MRLIKLFFAAAAAAAVVAACGGGGGSAGSTPNGTTSADSKVVSFASQISKATLSNSGTDKVDLTVTALDASNNPVTGATVAVAVDSGVYTSASTSTVTDATGNQIGAVTIGGDKSNRTITATVKVRGIVKTFVIPVVGSKLTLTPVPATPQPGQSVKLDMSVSDAADVGISNVPIVLTGSAGFSGTLVADFNGKASVTAIAPAAEGEFLISASAAGVTSSKSLKVVKSGGASIPNALGVAVASSLTANPATVAPNVTGAVTTNRVKLSAKFLQAGNAGLVNMRVRFELVSPLLGAGEFISTGDSFVYSDSSGTAESEYVPGTRTSPTNGVTVRACFNNSDFAVGTCPNQIITNLTVNTRPLALSIGNYNKLQAALGGIIYFERFAIQVADASGAAVPDAVVSASVDITHFGKGSFGSLYQIFGLNAPDISHTYGVNYTVNGTPVTYSSRYLPTPTIDPLAIATQGNAWCINEDTNRNGFLEAGEDLNGDGSLTPRKSEIVVSFVDGNKTDKNGQLLVQVSYPQNVGSWLAYTLKVTTSVVGSEGSNQRSFITGALQSDLPNGSFLTSPYGNRSCQDRY